jgi:hypothetical protein
MLQEDQKHHTERAVVAVPGDGEINRLVDAPGSDQDNA